MEIDRVAIKQRILEEVTSVEEHVLELKELTKPISPENAIGRISRMDAINNKSVNEASLRQAEIKLKQLKIALAKINKDDFAICTRCQKPIPLGRIMLMPQANKCVNCA